MALYRSLIIIPGLDYYSWPWLLFLTLIIIPDLDYYSWPWLLFLTLECSVTNVIKWTWTDPRHKNFVYINFSHCICYVSSKNIYMSFLLLSMRCLYLIIIVLNVIVKICYLSSSTFTSNRMDILQNLSQPLITHAGVHITVICQ